MALLISVTYLVFLAKPIYISTSKIMSSSGKGNINQAVGLAAQLGINLPISQSETKWVYPEIIKSRTLAKSLLKRKFETMKYGIDKSLLEILTYDKTNKNINPNILRIIATDRLLKMIDVFEDMKTSILTVKIKSDDPKFSFDLNSALIQELDNHQRKYEKTKTVKTKDFILERIKDVEKELMLAEEELKKFKNINRRIENSPSLQLQEQRFSREVTVLIGVFTTLKQQLEMAKIEEVKESDFVIILDYPEIPLSVSKPDKKVFLLISLVLSIGISALIILYREFYDKKEKENFSQALKIILRNIFKNK